MTVRCPPLDITSLALITIFDMTCLIWPSSISTGYRLSAILNSTDMVDPDKASATVSARRLVIKVACLIGSPPCAKVRSR